MGENANKGHFTDNEFWTIEVLMGYSVWMPLPF